MTFFSHCWPSFVCLLTVYTVLSEILLYTYIYHIIMTLFFRKNLYFAKKLLRLTFFLTTSHFPAHPITQLLQILGGRMHGPSPNFKLWGDRAPSPPKSPPMFWRDSIVYMQYKLTIALPIIFKSQSISLLPQVKHNEHLISFTCFLKIRMSAWDRWRSTNIAILAWL